MMTPLSTCVNNGIEHVLGVLVAHWEKMLYQPYGNFAHQRMEQLDPFEMLRFYFPVILTVLSQLRGICSWDSETLGPFIARLQLLNKDSTEDPVQMVHNIIQDMRENIVGPISGGIRLRIDLLREFLRLIDMAIDAMKKEAQEIKDVLSRYEVEKALCSAREMMNTIILETPSSEILDTLIRTFCVKSITGSDLSEKITTIETGKLKKHVVSRALNLLAPKDKRTLIELLENRYDKTQPAVLLLKRARTLLQRELKRDAVDAYFRKASRGGEVRKYSRDTQYFFAKKPKIDYIDSDYIGVYTFIGQVSNTEFTFKNFLSDQSITVDVEDGKTYVRTFKWEKNTDYIVKDGVKKPIVVDVEVPDVPLPVEIRGYCIIAENIVRAQKAFMVIELRHGTKFSYNGFMEFADIREQLLQLMSVSQIQCEALDDARLNRLKCFSINSNQRLEIDIKDCEHKKKYFVYRNQKYDEFELVGPDDPKLTEFAGYTIFKVPPQSMLVIGSGPTGLLTTLHCLDAVLLSGGTMRLYESRDAFQQGGATFERSQIVRLDARWIAMLRYHLGTIYEDVFVPATGETDSHYGNSLPLQGFVEITIKELENMINFQVAKAVSRGLLKHDTQSNAQYNFQRNELVKKGAALKKDDLILRQVDQFGNPSPSFFTWKVVKLNPPNKIELSIDSDRTEYVVYRPLQAAAFKFKLKGIVDSNEGGNEGTTYYFESLDRTATEDFTANSNIEKSMPDVYHAFTTNLLCESFIVESLLPYKDESSNTVSLQQTLSFADYEQQEFQIDIAQGHVVTATGKPHHSDHHINLTTEEPYGVCCLSGLKVSMGMHNFGTRRWRNGLEDDIRSLRDQNTRVIGDFTKIVNSKLIALKMVEVLENSPDWRVHFELFAMQNGYGVELAPNIYFVLLEQVKIYLRASPYERHHLQTRFFETGDNFYLGMEFTREYDRWKKNVVASVRALVSEEVSGKFARTDENIARDQKSLRNLTGQLSHHIDRLWYFATLEVIRTGDVYNPGGRGKVPRLYLIDHHIPMALSELQVGETFIPFNEDCAKCFHIGDQADFKIDARYELLVKNGATLIYRNHEGHTKRVILEKSGATYFPDFPKTYIEQVKEKTGGSPKVVEKSSSTLIYKDHESSSTLTTVSLKKAGTTYFYYESATDVKEEKAEFLSVETKMMVRLGGNLTRGPDGVSESKVAISTFPVGHYVNHRTMKLTNSVKGYTFAFLGDEQSSPHFMRYSGLTGAAINVMAFNHFIVEAIEGIDFTKRFDNFAAITNWSNGEVVQRGTSSNYGVDGFLRPGFSYSEGVKYLYAKLIEHIECKPIGEHDIVLSVLSKDWKAKFAAALIPRGMEQRDGEWSRYFLQPMMVRIRRSIFDHILTIVESDAVITERVPNIKALMQGASTLLDPYENDVFTDDCWPRIATFVGENFPQDVPKDVLGRLDDIHCTNAKHLEDIIKGVVEHAKGRTSTLADTQPKSVDSFIAMFPPECHVFASNLAQSSTISAFVLAIRVITRNVAVVGSLASAYYSMGTATNGSRYKNRHEEWKNEFYCQRYDHILKQVFSCMAKKDRDNVPLENNPFFILIEAKKTQFVKKVYYYDYAHPVEFLRHYEDFIKSFAEKDQNRRFEYTRDFIKVLLRKHLADIYHVNSYLQELLVDLYLLVEEMVNMEFEVKKGKPIPHNESHLGCDDDSKKVMGTDMYALFERLRLFKPRLQMSLQTGAVSVGAFRKTDWSNGHVASILKLLYYECWSLLFILKDLYYKYWSLLFCRQEKMITAPSKNPLKSFLVETKEIYDDLVSVQKGLDGIKDGIKERSGTIDSKMQRFSLSREIVDFQSLFHANRESYVASCLIVSGMLNFCTGTVFFVSNAVLLANRDMQWARYLSLAASWSFGTITPLTAMMAVYFFLTHLSLLTRCFSAVGSKLKSLNSSSFPQDTEQKEKLASIRRAAFLKAFGLLMRVIASACAVVALPWALAADIGDTEHEYLPILLAGISFGLQMLSALLLYVIDITVIYRLTPLMGKLCCSPFEEEIEQRKEKFKRDNSQVRKRQEWEYIAVDFLHEYRFDTIFSSNRFGSIMQFIHNDPADQSLRPTSISHECSVPRELAWDIEINNPLASRSRLS